MRVSFSGAYTIDDEDAKSILANTPGIAQETRAVDFNLGFGNIYYGLTRLIRPRHALVIGSGNGFTPGIVALALKHNDDGGIVEFVDPSCGTYCDGQFTRGNDNWATPEAVRARFALIGAEKYVRHWKMMNDEFFKTYDGSIDLAIIDGGHDYDNVLLDYNETVKLLNVPGYVLLHDSNNFYNSVGLMGVADVVRQVKKIEPEVVTFPGAAGLTLVRVAEGGALADAPVPRGFALVAALVAGGAIGLGYWLGHRGRHRP